MRLSHTKQKHVLGVGNLRRPSDPYPVRVLSNLAPAGWPDIAPTCTVEVHIVEDWFPRRKDGGGESPENE